MKWLLTTSVSFFIRQQKRNRQVSGILALTCLPFILFAQEYDAPKWAFKGYLKYLNSTTFIPADPALFPFPSEKLMINDHLLHNRLDLAWFASESLTLNAEVRNRFFWGDQVRLTLLQGGDFISLTDEGSDDYFDWSWGTQNDNGYALHTTLDRLYAEWTRGKWELNLGRQRVNWGIATIWNPNDIFNAYNFTDFDYEERPGSDALRIKRYLGFASSIEVAVNAFDNWEQATAAMLAKFHTGTYDWQLLAGVVENHTVIGGGWAGNLGNASFKGEVSWFRHMEDKDNSVAVTTGIDYTFQNQLYVNGGFLFNSNGTTSASEEGLLSFRLSAFNLYPFKYSVLTQAAYPVTPLLQTALITVYSPGESHPLFLNPVLTYSMAQNWDLDLVGQLFFQKTDKYRSEIQAFYLRIKWSF